MANRNTADVVGWCLEVHDLAAPVISLPREKDLDFVRTMARHAMLDGATLSGRLAARPLPVIALKGC